MLEQSRFNKQLHNVSMLMNNVHKVGMILKKSGNCAEYILDLLMIAMCDKIWIFNLKLIKLEGYRAEPETLCLRATLRPKNDISMELEFNY